MSDPKIDFVEHLYQLERKVDAISNHPQLGNASVHGQQIDFYDRDNNRLGSIGGDNGLGFDYEDGPEPPVPAPPAVSADAGVIAVEWAGQWADIREPSASDPDVSRTRDLEGVEIHVSSDPLFEPDVVSMQGVFTSADGGSYAVGPMRDPGEYFVRLRARSRSGKVSAPSEMVAVEVAAALIDLQLAEMQVRTIDAQESADGKNRIFRGPTVPDPALGPFNVGDTWFNTADSNMPSQWDGERWVSVADERVHALEQVQADLQDQIDSVRTDGVGNKVYRGPTMPVDGVGADDVWFKQHPDGEYEVHFRNADNTAWVPSAESGLGDLSERLGLLDSRVEQNYEDLAGGITQAEADAIAQARVDAQALADAARDAAVAAATESAAADAQAKADAAQAAAAAAAKEYADLVASGAADDAIQAAAADAQAKADEAKQAAIAAASEAAATKYDPTVFRVTGWTKTGTTMINGGKIAADTIIAAHIRAGAIGATAIAADAIDATHIQAGAIGVDELAANAVVAGKIAANAVTAREILAGSITAESGIIASLDAGKITSGILDSDRIKAGSLVADTVLVPGSAGSTVIRDGAVTTEKIAVGAITAESGIIGSLDVGKVVAGELDGMFIKAGAITAEKIKSGAVTATALSADAINGKTITGATVQTSSTYPRVAMDTRGFHAWDAAGRRTFHIDQSTGEVSFTGNQYQSNDWGSLTIGPDLYNDPDDSPAIQFKQNGTSVYGSAGIYLRKGDSTGGELHLQGPGVKNAAGKYLGAVLDLRHGTNGFQIGTHTASTFMGMRASIGASELVLGSTDNHADGKGRGALSLYTDGASLLANGNLWRNGPYIDARLGDGVTVWSSRGGTAAADYPILMRGSDIAVNSMSGKLKLYAYDGAVTLGSLTSAGAWNSKVDLDASGISANSYNGTISFLGRNTSEANVWISYLGVAGDLWANRFGVRTRNTGENVMSAQLITNNTTSSSANVMVSGSGILYMQTSARRYKSDIAPLLGEFDSYEDFEQRLLSIEPKTWIDKSEAEERAAAIENGRVPDQLVRHVGAIAEDFHDAGLSRFVTYDSEGQVNGLSYDRLGVALIPVVARLRDRVVALESALADLSNKR